MLFIKINKMYFFAGGLILVLVFFITFSKENPTSFKGMVKKAEAYVQKGKVAFALEEYNKIIRLYPDTYDIHLKLGQLYEEMDEMEHAKIEYIRAIRLKLKHRHEAHLALVFLYVKDNRYGIAKEIIKDIENIKNNDLQAALARIFYDWGKHLQKTDRLEAIRTFKQAYNYAQKTQPKLAKEIIKHIERNYADISDTLMENNEAKKAIEILNLSISCQDNALAHYKLAKIYETDKKDAKIDEALEEYNKAFQMNPNVGNKNSYVNLLMKKARVLAKNGDTVKSKLCYLKAKKLDSKLDVPKNPNNKILFNLIATKINEDIERDILIPGIIFKFTNISKTAVTSLRAKIVFIKDDKTFSIKIITIADEANPIKGDSASSDISVYSDKLVKHIFDDHDLRVQVYISQVTSDEWKLFRNIDIERKRHPVKLQH